MNEALRFLHSLAQALSTAALYAPGHPAAERSIGLLWGALESLLGKAPDAGFLFLGGAPVYDGRALHELASWPWSDRLAAIGVQRIEFDDRASPESLSRFVGALEDHLATGQGPTGLDERFPGIRYGEVTVTASDDAEEEAAESEQEEPEVEPLLQLDDELTTMGYVFAEARERRLARAETDVVARLLGAQVEKYRLPQVAPSEDFDAYPEYLAINTALLAMTAANSAGVDLRGRHRLGVAALLADVGMMRLGEPFERLDSLPGELRSRMESHTTEGARFILDMGGRGLDLAAVVALEHHLRPDGNGYPARRLSPPQHWASRMVAVASAYSSLRAPRPFRPAWSNERAVGHITSAAGTVYHPEAAAVIAAVLTAAPAG